jgi:hypothetical protein
MADNRKWIAENWAECCETGDENHIKAGTSLEKIRKWTGVRSYAKKYMGKIDENEREKGIGRVWGFGGEVPYSCCVIVPIENKARFRYLRFLRKRTRTKGKRLRSFIVFDPWIWFKNFQEIADPLPF